MSHFLHVEADKQRLQKKEKHKFQIFSKLPQNSELVTTYQLGKKLKITFNAYLLVAGYKHSLKAHILVVEKTC